MSRLGRTQLIATAQVKRSATAESLVNLNQHVKRTRHNKNTTYESTRIEDIENMTDTAANSQKRANFSALTVTNPNGVNKISTSITNAKPGSAKKLIIKNFKSKYELR